MRTHIGWLCVRMAARLGRSFNAEPTAWFPVQNLLIIEFTYQNLLTIYCRKDRISRGGSVAIVYKTSIVCTEIYSPPKLECVVYMYTVTIGSLSFVIVAVYRPPGTSDEYIRLLNDFLTDKFNNPKCKIILAGDFNFLPHNNWVNYREGQIEQSVSCIPLDVTFSLEFFHTNCNCAPTRIHESGEPLLDLVFLSGSFV